MSFLKKLFGGGEAPRQPGRDGRPSPTPAASAKPVSTVPPKPPRPLPALPIELPPGPRRMYLEYVGGASAKFYAATLEEDEGESWTVRFNFGRIGFPRIWAVRVEKARWAKALAAYDGLVSEKEGKGYEFRPWPGYLKLPDGATLGPDDDGTAAGGGDVPEPTLFRAARRGTLPAERGGMVAGIPLPDGQLYAPMEEGGSRGDAPVIWASLAPVTDIVRTWAHLAASFNETGLWPFVVDAANGFQGFGDYLMDMPRTRHAEVLAILRKGWNDNVGIDEDSPGEEIAPFGKQFPGLADATPGVRPTSIDDIVAGLQGHLGLAAVHRPADALDAVGWMGAANYDGDPLRMSIVLRSWEARFDAYLVGLGTATVTLAVGRPTRDLASATAIAAEHFAFCPDNISQGAGSISAYAPLLVNAPLWSFWWD